MTDRSLRVTYQKWVAIIAAALVIPVLLGGCGTEHPGPAPSLAVSARTAGMIVWDNDYQRSIPAARAGGVPVLLAIVWDQCSHCEKMEETSYRDPHVLALSEYFHCVMVDGMVHPEIRQRYPAPKAPTHFIIYPDGRLSHFVGYRGPSALAQYLQEALAQMGIETTHRAGFAGAQR